MENSFTHTAAGRNIDLEHSVKSGDIVMQITGAEENNK